MENLIDLSGKKIFVTGASSGIGQACAVLFSHLGAQIVISGRNEERLKETMDMLSPSESGNHISIPFDVTDFDRYVYVFDKAVSDGIKLSGFVHSAGIQRPIPIRSFTIDKISQVMDTNFTSFLLLVSIFTKKKYSETGNIVGISSTSSQYPMTAMTIYSASKAAMEAAAMSMALELAKSGRRINCILPGSIYTNMSKGVTEEASERMKDKFLLGTEKPDVVAEMAAFLLSDASRYVTGRNFFCDGGLLGNPM